MKSPTALRTALLLAILSIAGIGHAHHGEMTDHVVNNLVYYMPALVIVAVTAFFYFRKRKTAS